MGNMKDLDLQKPLSVSLVITPDLAQTLTRESSAIEEAKAFVIDSPEMASAANSALQDIKRRVKLVDEWYGRFMEPVKQLQATAAEFFGPARESLKAAETCLKTGLLGWQQKEDARIAAERAEREAVARKLRQEAEAKAAAERARAEEAAREADRKAREAEEARKKAEAEGNARAAAAAAAEAAKQQEKAKAAIENGERKAAEAQLAAAAAPVAAPIVEPAKLEGFSTRKNWVAEFAQDTTAEQALEKIVAAIAGVPEITGRRDLLSLIVLEMKQANKWAKAQEKNFNVPGLRAVNKPVAASKG